MFTLNTHFSRVLHYSGDFNRRKVFHGAKYLRVDATRGDSESEQQKRARKVKLRIASLSGKLPRKNEPLDLELIVLFGSVSIILLVPWLIHDYRFICLIPACLLVVPGLFAVFLHACRDVIRIFSARGTSAAKTASKKERERLALSQKSLGGFLKKCLPFLQYWGGFL